MTRLGARVGAHEYLTATAVFAVIACLWFWPLFKGDQVGQSYTLWAQVPWRATHPESLPQRAIFPDVAQESYPWMVLARRQLRDGHLPLWNPYEYGGMTFVGNLQSALFFPLTWPLLLLPLGYAWGVVAVGKLVLGALGTYAFSRELRSRRTGAILAGTVYMLSAPFLVWLQWPVGMVYAMFPWLLFATTRLVRRGTPGAMAVFALVLALAILAGHPETGLTGVTATGIYLIGLLVFDRRREWSTRERVLTAGKWAAAGVLGGVAAGVALVPFFEAYGPSITRSADYTWGSFVHLPLSFSLDYAVAGLFGDGEPHVYGASFFNAVAAHFGLPALVLALIALVHYRRRAAALALAGMSLIGLMAVYGVPPVRWVADNVPPWSKITIAERGNFVMALAGAVGAGAGFTVLTRQPLPVRRVVQVVVGVGVAIVVGVAAAQARGVLEAPRDVKRDSLLVAAGLLLAAGGLLLALGRVRIGLAFGLALGLVVLSLANLQNFNVTLAPDKAYPAKPRAIEALQREPGVFRIAALRQPSDPPVLLPNGSALYGLESVEGYDFPLSKRWSDFQTQVLRFPALRAESASAMGTPTPAALTGYRMVNARYYVAAPGGKAPAAGFRSVYSGPDATIFRDDRALPRAYVVPATREVSRDQALEELAAGRLDPRRVALVPPGSAAPRAGSAAAFRPARVDRIAPDHVRVRLEPGSAGWLVLANAYSSAWSAEVDGHSAKIEPTDFVAMGVPVSAGARTVDFRLDRASLWLGAALSVAGFAGIGALALAGLRRPVRTRE